MHSQNINQFSQITPTFRGLSRGYTSNIKAENKQKPHIYPFWKSVAAITYISINPITANSSQIQQYYDLYIHTDINLSSIESSNNNNMVIHISVPYTVKEDER